MLLARAAQAAQPFCRECQVRFYTCPCRGLSSADCLTSCTAQDSFPKHRALTKQPPVQTDTHTHSEHGSLSLMEILLNL